MTEQPKCIYCGATDQSAPLVNLTYKGTPLYICAEHLPVLIHHPEQLVTQLEQAAKKEN